jgi:hypothetical protein
MPLMTRIQLRSANTDLLRLSPHLSFSTNAAATADFSDDDFTSAMLLLKLRCPHPFH